jgi:hypothetical protein
VKFILMNSFSTSDDTKNFLSKTHSDLVAVSGGFVLGGGYRGRGRDTIFGGLGCC